MSKVLKVEGMNCKHCEAKIDKALSALDNTSATFDLDNKTVTVETTVTDEVLKEVISNAGYTVSEIS